MMKRDLDLVYNMMEELAAVIELELMHTNLKQVLEDEYISVLSHLYTTMQAIEEFGDDDE